MPIYNYKCSKCNEISEILVGKTVGLDNPDTCPKCGAKNTLKKQFSMQGISGEVVGGYEYEYGKKSWKRTASDADKAAILMGEKDPY